MIDHIASHLFLYVLFFATVVMAAAGHFVIAPMERRNHERKLALLQEKIKKHQVQVKGAAKVSNVTEALDTDGT